LAVSVLEPAAEVDFEKEKLSMLRLTTCGLTILFAFAPAARAVDGIVLINQSTITNGLPGCPTGGHFPIIVCQTGSYRLSGNLTVPDVNTTAIQITTDNVTLDLNGFSIIGPAVCSGGPPVTFCSPFPNSFPVPAGISSSNAGISVSNGTVRGVGIGIVLRGANSRVVNVAALGNAVDGIDVNSGIVSSCIASNNGISGIFVQSSAKIVDNLTTGNHNDGIQTGGFGSGLISGNLTFQNGGAGIGVDACPSLIVMNKAFGNLFANIATLGSGCVLVNNDAP
jgi:hypothetical protein